MVSAVASADVLRAALSSGRMIEPLQEEFQSWGGPAVWIGDDAQRTRKVDALYVPRDERSSREGMAQHRLGEESGAVAGLHRMHDGKHRINFSDDVQLGGYCAEALIDDRPRPMSARKHHIVELEQIGWPDAYRRSGGCSRKNQAVAIRQERSET